MSERPLKPSNRDGNVTYRFQGVGRSDGLMKCAECGSTFPITYPASWNRQTLMAKALEELKPCERHPKDWNSYDFIEPLKIPETEIMEFREHRRGRPRRKLA